MNPRIAKLYLILFGCAFGWNAWIPVSYISEFFAGRDAGQSKGLLLTQLPATLSGLLLTAAFAIGVFLVFVWPKLFCARLAWGTLRRRPVKTGILCGIAPILTLAPLGIELVLIVLLEAESHLARVFYIGLLLLFALDIVVWVLLCSSDRPTATGSILGDTQAKQV